MRIAIFTDTYLPDVNGVVTSIKEFSEIMADRGHQVMIFCPKPRGHRDESQHKNIKVKRYSSISLSPKQEVSSALVKVAMPSLVSVVRDLRNFSPDVVHIQTPLTVGCTALVASKVLKIKNIQTYHTYIPDMMVYLNPKTIPGVDKLLSKSADNLKSIKKLLESEIKVNSNFEIEILKKAENTADEVINEKRNMLTDSFAWNLTRTIYNRADLVLTPSEVLKDELESNGVKARVEVLSNGINMDFFEKKTDHSPSGKLVCTGRLGFEKNIDVVIKAFNIVAEENKKLTLDIIGDGPARKSLEKSAKELGIANRVKFLGFVSREKLKGIYSGYDLFITASTMETQGLVILEAMSVGLPVIGVDKLAVPEIVRDGINGYVSEPFNEKEMAKNIMELYAEPKRLEQFGKKSLEIAREHNITKCADRLAGFYKEFAKAEVLVF